jgi:hypothetical protein
MTKRPPLAVILVVIVLCFALGLLNVLIGSPEEIATPPPNPPTPTAIAENLTDLRSVLIVGVDELNSPTPSLRALWVLLYEVSGETLYLHGVPLDAATGSPNSRSLKDLFAWSIQDGLDPEFTSTLYQILPLSPDLIVVNDDAAFASAVNYLGGVDIEGAKFDGESILAFLSLSWDKPEILINNQSLILEALIPKALSSAPSPELSELIELIPEHVYLSQDVTDAVAMLTPLREISPENIFFILLSDESTSD